jgi:hypothetical protein
MTCLQSLTTLPKTASMQRSGFSTQPKNLSSSCLEIQKSATSASLRTPRQPAEGNFLPVFFGQLFRTYQHGPFAPERLAFDEHAEF